MKFYVPMLTDCHGGMSLMLDKTSYKPEIALERLQNFLQDDDCDVRILYGEILEFDTENACTVPVV